MSCSVHHASLRPTRSGQLGEDTSLHRALGGMRPVKVSVILFINTELLIYRGFSRHGVRSSYGVEDRDARRVSELACPISLWASESQCLLERYNWTVQGSLPLGCKIVQTHLDLVIRDCRVLVLYQRYLNNNILVFVHK